MRNRKLKILGSIVALLGGTIAGAGLAQEVTYFPADKDKNGYVSAQEWSTHQAHLQPPVQIAERAPRYQDRR